MSEPSVHFDVNLAAASPTEADGWDPVSCEITLPALQRLYGGPIPQGLRPPDIFRVVHEPAERAAIEKIRREGSRSREPIVITTDDLIR